MKLKIPSSHVEFLLSTYDPVNRFRLYKNSAVLYYSDKPNFTIPVIQAYDILNKMRKIKKVEIKDNRIYLKFKKSVPRSEIVMNIIVSGKKLNYSKCLNTVTRYGPVKYFSVKDDKITVIYSSLLSYFVATEKFKRIASIGYQ